MRAIAHYLSSLFILFIYGIQVCPFLESLSPIQLGVPMATALAVQWLLRGPLKQRWVESASYESQVRRQLTLDFILYAASGAVLTLYFTFIHQFPMESGLKVLVGFLTLGFFAAVDLALEHERLLAEQLHAMEIETEAGATYFPVSQKLALFAAISAVLMTTVLFLVINKDLLWLLDSAASVSLHDAQQSILKEFLFVALITLLHMLNVIRSYAGNLRFFFDTENRVLIRTNEGKLDARVPVSTNDEFGVMAHQTNMMVRSIRKRTEEIQRTQDVAILGLATLAETRDNETGGHILRTQRYVRALAEHLQSDKRFTHLLTQTDIELLYKSAPLHDIGKVGIPDAILLKPEGLTEEEFEIMKTHAQLGSEAIQVAERELGSTSFLRYAREIAETHHEKWDGSGYPKGLKGEEIPLSGRLMAVSDVYDALISKRVYKSSFSHEKARRIIVEGHGTHFDPVLVDAFITIENQFMEIASQHKDRH
ncbi:MAG: HD domain-containing protein [Candidatus Sedimenticola sp. (ex Thyasira tokunagai)]